MPRGFRPAATSAAQKCRQESRFRIGCPSRPQKTILGKAARRGNHPIYQRIVKIQSPRCRSNLMRDGGVRGQELRATAENTEAECSSSHSNMWGATGLLQDPGHRVEPPPEANYGATKWACLFRKGVPTWSSWPPPRKRAQQG